jgi:hypothetical protein
VSGVIVEIGGKAVGTTVSGVVRPPAEVSPAGRESIAARTAPEIKVIDIKDLGDTCRDRS